MRTPKELPASLLLESERADFWSRVELGTPDQCWDWRGANGRYGTYREFRAHRVALFIRVGPPFVGAFACHHCDNPSCCNPAHLYWGTAGDNSRDAVKVVLLAARAKNGKRGKAIEAAKRSEKA